MKFFCLSVVGTPAIIIAGNTKRQTPKGRYLAFSNRHEQDSNSYIHSFDVDRPDKLNIDNHPA
jgi:hypothetical protein